MTNVERPDDSPDQQALSAYLDGELSPSERAAMAERLARDPESAEVLAAWRAQDNALRAVFALDDAPRVMVVRPRARRRYLMAACWLGVGLACGFLLHMLMPMLGDERPRFAQRADIAYAVYAPEQRHAVEVAASQQDHLVTWLSKRLNRTLTIPSLSEYGFELVGGRLLPGEEGPAAQFMYQNAAGERLTLYMTSVPREQYKIKVLRDGARRTFYWTVGHAGYALSGQIGEAKLQAISYDTCSALGGDPKHW